VTNENELKAVAKDLSIRFAALLLRFSDSLNFLPQNAPFFAKTCFIKSTYYLWFHSHFLFASMMNTFCNLFLCPVGV
jgi:hypothetical protein